MGNKVQYNQDLVNTNLENLLDIPSGSTEVVQLVDNQIVQKKKGRGGARPNSGRKIGSTVKLSTADILKEIARIDKPFAEGLAEDYKKARDSGDLHVIQRYQQMFLGKVLADKQELDVTSNGQTIGASFTFPTIELPEWNDNNNVKPISH